LLILLASCLAIFVTRTWHWFQHLMSQGLSVENLREIGDETSALERTRAAAGAGADVIVQAVLAEGGWFGRADVLREVPRQSKLGDWAYEIYHCKLAQDTKASTILQ
jgi:hypothetical protein